MYKRQTPNRPDCLSVIGLAREVAATYQQPLTLHEPEVKGGADGVLTDLLDIETPAADLVPRYTARMAVSYTHLDVYKRQLPGGAGPGAHGGRLEVHQFLPLGRTGPGGGDGVSVHLYG